MATILVTTDAADFVTAIGMANNNDTIRGETADSPFTGANNKNLDAGGLDPLTIEGETGNPIDVVIDCENSGRGFVINNGEAATFIIDGLRITNGLVAGTGDGGGLLISQSDPTISNCIIDNNECGDSGGGVFIDQVSDPTFTNVLVRDNTAGDEGGGFYVLQSSLTLNNCTVADNNSDDDGGGFYVSTDTVIVMNDGIIWGNAAVDEGHQVFFGAGAGASMTLNYCCYSNGANDIDNDFGATFDATNNCITGDPLFVTGDNGDYYLSQILAGEGSDSPCLDTGSDTAANLGMDAYTTRTDNGFDEAQVDMGYHDFDGILPPVTWSQSNAQAKEGTYSLKGVGSGSSGDDYWMQEIEVVEGEEHYVEVGVYVTAYTDGYAWLEAYDATGAAQIAIAKVTAATSGWRALGLYFTVPANCVKVEGRLGVHGNMTAYFDCADGIRLRAKDYS